MCGGPLLNMTIVKTASGEGNFFFHYLMQFKAHSDCWCHHLLQKVQVGEDPLVFGGDAEVALEQGVEAAQEGLQAGRKHREQRRYRRKKGKLNVKRLIFGEF